MAITAYYSQEYAHFYLANEYADFMEFLEDKLGVEQLQALREEFLNWYEVEAQPSASPQRNS